jgi:hypothetical protein
MRSIFVSYRHDDSFANAKLLVEHLGRWLPDADIFIDESGIEAGAEWRATLQKTLDEAQAVLVVIGPRWTTMATQMGLRRLDDPDDIVRWEVCQALASAKRVVPVLDGTPPSRWAVGRRTSRRADHPAPGSGRGHSMCGPRAFAQCLRTERRFPACCLPPARIADHSCKGRRTTLEEQRACSEGPCSSTSTTTAIS